MDVEDLMDSYGLGDNSVTDRMFYEDALNICQRLESLRTPLTSRISVEYVRQQLEKIVRKQKVD